MAETITKPSPATSKGRTSPSTPAPTKGTGKNAVAKAVAETNAKKNTANPAPAPDQSGGAARSIINPKYKDRYKDAANHDQLTKLLNGRATATKVVDKTVPDGDGTKTVKTTVPDGVNVDALFQIAQMNNLDVSAYSGQRDSAGFAGRFRMTVANMLRASMKKRHGLFVPDAKGKPEWVDAEPAFLKARGAPEKPTHDRTGTKIVVAKPAADKEAAKA